MKILGCSLESEFWKCDPSWEHISIYGVGTFEVPSMIVLEYLQNGIPLLALRTTIYCKLTEEEIGTPILWTDGFFCWMTSYAFYISKGMIQLDSGFLSHMENVNFIKPLLIALIELGLLNISDRDHQKTRSSNPSPN
jgi:hypothetical protein